MAKRLLRWFVILTVVAAAVSNADTEWLPPSCCPNDWQLVTRSGNFECVDPGVPLTGDMVLLGKTQNPYSATTTFPSNETMLPECEQPELVFFNKNDDDVKITPNSCLVLINGSFVGALKCPLQDNEEMLSLHVIHKCCPMLHTYDALKKKCMPKSGNFTSTSSFIYANDRINCPRDKALFEYHVAKDEVRYENNRLVLRKLRKTFAFNDYCIEQITGGFGGASNASELQFLVRTCDEISVCRKTPCIRRCCTDGEIISKGNPAPYCKQDETDRGFHSFESLNINGNFTKPPVFGILRNLDCPKFRLDPDSYDDEAHSISDLDGSLYVMTTRRNYSNSQYCVEKIHNSTWPEQKLYTFLCFDKKVVGSDRIRFKLYPIGLLISCSFYGMTLLVYLSMSKLRNLPGQILICLVTSLFCAYFAIACGQLMPTSNDTICFVSGFFIYFCLMAAFAWMNVMCFDIWQTFGTAKKKRGFNENNRRRFILYSAYGWGLPSLLTTTTVLLTKSNSLSESIKPHFGHGRCWFTYDTLTSANLVFFSGPVGLLFLFNFILFSLTLRYCNKVKKEIFRMQSSNCDKPALKRRFFMDKARFTMNTKLFVVMGITWLLELLSIVFYDHKKTFFWAISDSFNVLLGVFVFFIFVFKKRIWQAILIKFGIRSKETTRNARNTTTCGTNSTFVHSMSMVRLNAIDGNATLLHTNLRTPSM